MKTALALLLGLFCTLCLAQKWVDENGKVYYGTPPPGVKVKPAAMTGGTTSGVGSQGTATRSGAATTRKPGGPASGLAEEEARNRALGQRSDKAVRENNARVEQFAKDAKRQQQEQFQDAQRKDAVRQRRECQASGRC